MLIRTGAQANPGLRRQSFSSRVAVPLREGELVPNANLPELRDQKTSQGYNSTTGLRRRSLTSHAARGRGAPGPGRGAPEQG